MSWDSIWETVFKGQAWGKYPSESLIRFIARRFYNAPDRKQIKILEVGCGPGPNIWYLAREGFSAYGIDGSETAILQAKRRISEEGLNAHLETGDIVSLPYANSTFDAIVDVECLYANSSQNTRIILSEIYRCLKFGGLFYSRTLSDKMYLGSSNTRLNQFEFTNVSDGPVSGKGLARIMNKKEVNKIYGEIFDIQSVDKLDYTLNNNSHAVSEWVIICKKNQ
jgi:SAM-dependent methyltransferase